MGPHFKLLTVHQICPNLFTSPTSLNNANSYKEIVLDTNLAATAV